MLKICPPENTLEIDQSSLFSEDGTVNWGHHRLGWAIAGICMVLASTISFVVRRSRRQQLDADREQNITFHLRNYFVPDEQRQIVRILLMPVVWSTMSFLAYRFYRQFEYSELIMASYEGVALAAFLMLLFAYVRKSGDEGHRLLREKGRSRIPLPFCCLSYHPAKPAFLNVLKWSVLQYVIVKPLTSIIGCITEAVGVLCTASMSPYFASVYLTAINFVSMTIALFGLITWYGLTKQVLVQGKRRPLAKFSTIKLLAAVCFYQLFLVQIIAAHGLIHATPYWTVLNIEHGIVALATCAEMIFFAVLMLWAFSVTDFRGAKPEPGFHTPFWRSLGHALNFRDFAHEIKVALTFFWHYLRKRPGTSSKRDRSQLDVGDAFDAHHADSMPPREVTQDWTMVEKPSVSTLPAGDTVQPSMSQRNDALPTDVPPEQTRRPPFAGQTDGFRFPDAQGAERV